MDLAIEGIAVARGGVEADLGEDEQRKVDEAMSRPEVEIELRLPGSGASHGAESAELFFCDLGHEYVSFNSEYST
jgi:N-acetylglutamate synthase/N-acetylornithine aminotransferase